jgi:hypothetical protein
MKIVAKSRFLQSIQPTAGCEIRREMCDQSFWIHEPKDAQLVIHTELDLERFGHPLRLHKCGQFSAKFTFIRIVLRHNNESLSRQWLVEMHFRVTKKEMNVQGANKWKQQPGRVRVK